MVGAAAPTFSRCLFSSQSPLILLVRVNALESPSWPASTEPPSAADLLATLLDVSLTGVIVFRPLYAADGTTIIDLLYVQLNAAAQRMLALPAVPARTFLTLYPHAAATGIFAFYRDTFLSGKAGRFAVDYAYDSLDNYYQLAAQRCGDVLVVSFSDTADHARTAVEIDLRASQARERAARATADAQRRQLVALFEQAPVAIGYFESPQQVITIANSLMCALWGRPPADVLGHPLLSAVPELAGQGFETLIEQVYTTGEPFVGTETPATMLRDGELQTRYYNFVFQPFRDEYGAISGVMDVAVEVTELVQARWRAEASEQKLAAINQELATANTELHQTERRLRTLNHELEARVHHRTEELEAALRHTEQQREKLQEQENLLQQILAEVPAAVATLIGPDHRFSYFNASYNAFVEGRARLDAPAAEVLPELVAQGFVGLLDSVYASGTPFATTDTPVELRNPTTGAPDARYIDFVLQPLVDGRGQTRGILAFLVDVTEKVRARHILEQLSQAISATNAELRLTNEQLTRANADLDTFIYTASHDLRAPIVNIDGLIGALEEELPGEARRHPAVAPLLTMMHRAVARFLKTLDQLTDVAKLQQGGEAPSMAISIGEVIEEVRLDLAPQVAAVGAQLEIEVEACPDIDFAPKNLRSIVYNLLSNALKYHDPARPLHVQVRCSHLDGHIRLVVQDNGLGLAPARQPEMFTMFKRFHSHVEGSGVGLYMVKKIVENAGGRIEVESAEGAGATFRVFLRV